MLKEMQDKSVGFRLSEDAKAKWELCALNENKRLSVFIRDIVEKYVQEQMKKENNNG